MAQEKETRGLSGWLMVVALIAVLALDVFLFVRGGQLESLALGLTAVVLLLLDGFGFAGFTVVYPNQASVLTLFGVYRGTIKAPGFWWVNPLTRRKQLSLRVRNFESGRLKVNDRDGNPIEIAAVVVWRIVETFEAFFNVNDYENFVHVQSEAALRILATSYPYDAHEEDRICLRLSAGEVTDRLRGEIHERH